MVTVLGNWLPGLWVGALLAALALVVRRYFDPLPWRVVGLGALLVGGMYHAVLFGGDVLLPLDNLRGAVPFQGLAPTSPPGNFLQGDLVQLVLPSLAAGRRALAAGEWPLWNPLAGLGLPLLADPQAQALQPLQLLELPLTLAAAAGAVAALRVALAFLFTYLFARRQGLDGAPAAAAGLVYALGGFLQLWLGWPLANTAALLPLLLYAVVRAVAVGGRRDAALLGVATAAMLLAGHPETILYALGTAALLAAAELRALPRALRVRRLARAALAVLFAALLTAPVLLPTLDYLPRTARSAQLATLAPAPPPPVAWWARAGQLVAPNALGNTRYFAGSGPLYRGRFNTNEDAAGFPGSVAWLAALTGLAGRRRFARERLFQALAAAAVAALVVAATVDFALPLRLGFVSGFALAYLTGATLARLRDPTESRAPLLVALALVAALLLAATWPQLRAGGPPGLRVLQLGGLWVELRAVAAAAVLLFFWGRRRWAAAAVAVVAAYELLTLHLPANPPAPARLWLPDSPALSYLRQQAAGERMAALGPALPPNLAGLWDLADARLYNPMAPEPYHRLTAPLETAPARNVPEWGRPESPLYRLLGVEWLLIAPATNAKSTAPAAAARAGSAIPTDRASAESAIIADSAAPGAPWELAYQGVDAAVWHAPAGSDLCFFPLAVVPVDGDWAPCVRNLTDPRRTVCASVETAAANPPLAADAPLPAVRSTWRGASALAVRFAPSGPRLLACAVEGETGWRALLDGAPVPLFAVDGALLGARVDEEASRLDLLYRPRGFVLGCLFAALGWAALLALTLRPRATTAEA